MTSDPFDGWLEGIRHIPSSHFNQRPQGIAIDLLVIHNISLPPGQFATGHIAAFFQGQLDVSAHSYFEEIADLRVSAHFLIERDGAITQFVSLYDRAWHAGASNFNGVGNCNDFSIGIELEGCDDVPYADSQYYALLALTKILMTHFPGITPDRIVGHEQIAPLRKTDPGPAFDWAQYLNGLREERP